MARLQGASGAPAARGCTAAPLSSRREEGGAGQLGSGRREAALEGGGATGTEQRQRPEKEAQKKGKKRNTEKKYKMKNARKAEQEKRRNRKAEIDSPLDHQG